MSICIFMCVNVWLEPVLLVCYFYISNIVFPLGNIQRKKSTSPSLQAVRESRHWTRGEKTCLMWA